MDVIGAEYRRAVCVSGNRKFFCKRSCTNTISPQLVIGGYTKSAGHTLSYVDLQGTCFDEDFIATGFGLHLAIPILREHMDDGKWKTKTEAEAKKVLEECLKLLFYRDCKASCNVQFAVADAAGTRIEEPYRLDTFWGHEAWAKPGVDFAKGTFSGTQSW